MNITTVTRLGLRFLFELIAAEVFFCAGFPRRKNYILRFASGLAVTCVISGLAYWGSSVVQAKALQSIVFFFPITFTWAASLAIICFSFDVGWKELLFVGIGAYNLQHLGYSIYSILSYMSKTYAGKALSEFWLSSLIHALVMISLDVFFYFFFLRQRMNQVEIKEKDERMIVLAGITLFVNVLLSNSTHVDIVTPTSEYITRVLCRAYSISCCILSLAVLFAYGHQNWITRENKMLESLLYMERKQRQTFKDNLEVINLKCHDIKHQISLLKGIDNRDERNRTITELEDAVTIYDSHVKTGNDVLDLILTEKTLICQKYKIQLNIIADGEKLSFLSHSDIYSLFGNAIDNAIESLKDVEEEKRFISLRIFSRGNMLFIHEDNYCSSELDFEDGLPVTTKEDKNYHGFGVRSIQYIVSRYGGEMEMKVIDSAFTLDIAFLLGA